MLSQIQLNSGPEISEIIVVDQSRDSGVFLRNLAGVTEVLEFPVDEAQVTILGHDHPSSLNRALNSIEFKTSHVLVMDSDCFPKDSSWLKKIHNVTLASEPSYWSLSHPCFLCFPNNLAKSLDFSLGIEKIGIDTGRLVGLQISQHETEVQWTHPTSAFRGRRGHFYLDGSLYHHGSASFISASDARLTGQVNAKREARFKKKIAHGDFELSLGERFSYKLSGLQRKLRRLLKK